MSAELADESRSAVDGPDLLAERSVGGILVHFVAIPTGVVGAGLVYLLATNEFTKRNARNALDWHLTVLTVTVLAFGSLFAFGELTGQGVFGVAVLPSPLVAVASVVVPALLTLQTAVWIWTFFVGLAAMGKAVFGTAWRYPLSPAFVDRIESRIEFPGKWPVVVLLYVVSVPTVAVGLFGSTSDVITVVSGLGMIAVILALTPLTAAAMYLHGERQRSPDAGWHPHVVAYVGGPVLVGVAGYGLSRLLTDSINPAGDAMYVFLGAFWLSGVLYLGRWWTTRDR